MILTSQPIFSANPRAVQRICGNDAGPDGRSLTFQHESSSLVSPIAHGGDHCPSGSLCHAVPSPTRYRRRMFEFKCGRAAWLPSPRPSPPLRFATRREGSPNASFGPDTQRRRSPCDARVLDRLRHLLERGDAQPGDAVARAPQHLEAEPVERGALARLPGIRRNSWMTRPAIVGRLLVRQVPVHHPVEVADRNRPHGR